MADKSWGCQDTWGWQAEERWGEHSGFPNSSPTKVQHGQHKARKTPGAAFLKRRLKRHSVLWRVTFDKPLVFWGNHSFLI